MRTAGYKMGADSRADCAHAVGLLEEAERLIRRCVAREEPRSEPFYQAFDRQERLEREGKSEGPRRLPKWTKKEFDQIWSACASRALPDY